MKKRIGWIDALRALGAAAVVMIHVIGGWIDDPAGGGYGSAARAVLDGVVLQAAIRWAVPVFFMISGRLMLDPEREMGAEKLRRHVLRMLAVLGTFGFAFCLIEAFVTQGFSQPLATARAAVLALFEGRSWFHMWYVYALTGLYLLTPMLRAFARAADGQAYFATLAALFLLTGVVPTVNAVFGLSLTTLLPVSSDCLFYYLAGYAVKRFGVRRRTARAMLLAGLAAFVLAKALELRGISARTGGEEAGTMLYALGLFALAADSAFLERLSERRAVRSLARCSFGLYLTHPFFLNVLNKGLRLYPGALPIGVGEIAFFAFALGCGWLSSAALRRLPGFRRMLA